MQSPLSQFAGSYREWEPGPLLRDHVCCAWTNDLTHASTDEYRVVPDGCVDIFWTGTRLFLAGPDTTPVLERIAYRSCISGIRFYPGAAYAWLGVPLSGLLNARVPLAEFWGHEADRIEDKLHEASGMSATAILQQELLGRIARVGQPDRQIASLRGCASSFRPNSSVPGVRELTLRLGVSERTFRRRCIDAFGYGFKTLQRILRFQRLFHLAMQSPNSGLADLAFDIGFADQAHMSREVRRLCDMTPSELVRHLSGAARRFVQDDLAASPLSLPHEKNLRPHY